MPSRIEDYALLGDCHTTALVGRDGSLDWLCLPRFDSGACFAALLGTPENGRWQIAPAGAIRDIRRRYRDGTLILETEFATASGKVTLIDAMPPRSDAPTLVRLVVGQTGSVPMRMELIMRMDYGSIVPWVRRTKHGLLAIAGPDMLRLDSPVAHRGHNFTTGADFTVSAGQRLPFVLQWHPSHEPPPPRVDAEKVLRDTEHWWAKWSRRCGHEGEWRDAVLRSLITLKALTYAPTGGIVAAATTSLPEQLSGVRNWDYRFCWLRDSTFTLLALLGAGYHEEAAAWREWLLRALAGNPASTQIMYGLAGERRLTELSLDWLPGYEGAHPVRIGNAAFQQFQLDVYGEVIDTMFHCRCSDMHPDEPAWRLEQALLQFLESAWEQPDEGIWEVRGPRRHFTHSKVMAWVAMDRAVQAIERFGLDGPLERWRSTRTAIHDQVCREGFNAEVGAFTQYYGSKDTDASLLMIPLVGFLPATDPRMRGTVEAIERTLLADGFVARYPTHTGVDGLPPGEGTFLACTFWYADNLVLQSRHKEARGVFERLLDLRNDVGLLSEEYDTRAKRLVGNFPQAFWHTGLINTAHNLSTNHGPAKRQKQGSRADT